jgi:outer membrane lipoprotein SlyB
MTVFQSGAGMLMLAISFFVEGHLLHAIGEARSKSACTLFWAIMICVAFGGFIIIEGLEALHLSKSSSVWLNSSHIGNHQSLLHVSSKITTEDDEIFNGTEVEILLGESKGERGISLSAFSQPLNSVFPSSSSHVSSVPDFINRFPNEVAPSPQSTSPEDTHEAVPSSQSGGSPEVSTNFEGPFETDTPVRFSDLESQEESKCAFESSQDNSSFIGGIIGGISGGLAGTSIRRFGGLHRKGGHSVAGAVAGTILGGLAGGLMGNSKVSDEMGSHAHVKEDADINGRDSISLQQQQIESITDPAGKRMVRVRLKLKKKTVELPYEHLSEVNLLEGLNNFFHCFSCLLVAKVHHKAKSMRIETVNVIDLKDAAWKVLNVYLKVYLF